jgi:alcohol dehydrogenase
LRQRQPDSAALRKYAEAGTLLSGRGFTDEHAAQDSLVELLEAWTDRLDLPRLGDFGVTDGDITRIVANCRGGSMQTNPLVLEDTELADLVAARL